MHERVSEEFESRKFRIETKKAFTKRNPTITAKLAAQQLAAKVTSLPPIFENIKQAFTPAKK